MDVNNKGGDRKGKKGEKMQRLCKRSKIARDGKKKGLRLHRERKGLLKRNLAAKEACLD